jgi:acetyl-CoA/propionyl-CoA carboxylase biotin carboxyl carrier protein
MNTRLQVEHCVTEEVTGLDLVALQIAIASGERLPIDQDAVRIDGHAIECRINAEDPARGFLPTPGRLRRLRVPSGPGVRWDGGYQEGDEVSQYYDNLLGKLVVRAPARDQAIRRMVRALEELEIVGVHTTASAHLPMLRHPDFAAVAHSTKWVEHDLDPSLFVTDSDPPPDPAAEPAADVLVERTLPVEVDGKRFTVKLWVPDAPLVRTATAGRPRPRVARSAASGSGGSGTITAPMQGTIVKVLVNAGETVEVGQTLLVLEAMKMENNIAAETAGTVREVRVEPGQSVGTGDVLVVIE